MFYFSESGGPMQSFWKTDSWLGTKVCLPRLTLHYLTILLFFDLARVYRKSSTQRCLLIDLGTFLLS